LGHKLKQGPKLFLANSMASATNVAISFPALASSTNYLALLAKSANPVKHSTGLN